MYCYFDKHAQIVAKHVNKHVYAFRKKQNNNLIFPLFGHFVNHTHLTFINISQ